MKVLGFPGGSVVKNLPAHVGLISGWGRSPGGENSNSLQYSCLGNPMDRGALRAIVHEVTNSWTQLSDLTKYHPAISLVQSPYGSLL